MPSQSAELQMVEDHIAQGERHVTQQEDLLEWMIGRALPTDEAEDLLEEFKATLLQHREHRARMLRESQGL
jgi:hypothetical protein